MTHIPVMLNEVIHNAHLSDGMVIVDATFGRGGYSRAFLNSANCTVYGIDRDPDAVKVGQAMEKEFPNRFFMLQGCFGDTQQLLQHHNIDKVDRIVLDIGVSSPQIDTSTRGFSFKTDGPLDMRMSNEGISAKDIVNTYEHGPLAHIIKHYGEEKMAGKVASAILREREVAPIETTQQLANIVRSVVFKGKGKIDPATRTFQGLRIAVNDELGELERILNSSLHILQNEGRIVVVSFHSLEDRIVKQFIAKHSKNDGGNRHMPAKTIEKTNFRVEKKRAIKCTDVEASINPRARSAKLRTAIRTV